MLDFVNKNVPNCCRHWALRVGDSVWDLRVQEKPNRVTGVVTLQTNLWWAVEETYDEFWMGATPASAQRIHKLGEPAASLNTTCATVLY